MRGYITCECQNEVNIPTRPDHVSFHTEDAASVTFKCPDCNVWITASLHYDIIESHFERED